MGTNDEVETVGDLIPNREYDVTQFDVSRGEGGTFEGAVVRVSPERGPNDWMFTYNHHEGDIRMGKVEGVNEKNVQFIGEAAAIADEALRDRVPEADEITTIVDQIIGNDPTRNQEE